MKPADKINAEREKKGSVKLAIMQSDFYILADKMLAENPERKNENGETIRNDIVSVRNDIQQEYRIFTDASDFNRYVVNNRLAQPLHDAKQKKTDMTGLNAYLLKLKDESRDENDARAQLGLASKPVPVTGKLLELLETAGLHEEFLNNLDTATRTQYKYVISAFLRDAEKRGRQASLDEKILQKLQICQIDFEELGREPQHLVKKNGHFVVNPEFQIYEKKRDDLEKKALKLRHETAHCSRETQEAVLKFEEKLAGKVQVPEQPEQPKEKNRLSDYEMLAKISKKLADGATQEQAQLEAYRESVV